MELRLEALAEAGEDVGETAAWTARLLAELADVDNASVVVLAGDAPSGSKGVGGVTGVLLARLANLDALKALLQAARRWTTRTRRTIEVSIDGDVLKLDGASQAQQDRVIEVWIARHTPVA